MATNLHFDFRKGSGAPQEILYGELYLTPTEIYNNGSTTVLPTPTVVNLVNGQATIYNVTPTPNTNGLPAWLYTVLVRGYEQGGWSWLVGVPNVDASVEFTSLPTYDKTPPNLSQTTAAAIWEANRARAAAEGAMLAANTVVDMIAAGQLKGKDGVDSEAMAPAPTGGDDSTGLSAFLQANAGGKVKLRPGATYKLASTFTMATDTKIDLNGATLDITGMPAATTLNQRFAVKGQGTVVATVPITNAITAGTRQITGVSTTGMSAGDLVLLRNQEQPVAGMTRTDRDKGELNVIRSIDSSTQLTLSIGAYFDYGTNGLVIDRINPIKNVAISNGRIIGASVGAGHNGIQFQYGRNIQVTDVDVVGCEDTAVSMRTVWNGVATRGRLKDSTSSATIGTTGYGMALVEGSRFCEVNGAEFQNCRHFVAGGGMWPAIDNTVKDCFGTISIAGAYDVHESCMNWRFTNNEASGVAGGFGIRGQYITVENNRIYDCTGRAYSAETFDGVTTQKGIVFRNNEAYRSSVGVYFDTASRKANMEVTGNQFHDCGNSTTDVVILQNFDGLKVSGNRIHSPASRNGMLIIGTTTTPSTGLTWGDNTVTACLNNNVEINYVNDVRYSGGELSGAAKSNLKVTGCSWVQYDAPKASSPGWNCLQIDAGTDHTITGPQFKGAVSTSWDAVRVTGSNGFAVTGGRITAGRNAIYTTTTDNVLAVGVNVRGSNGIASDAVSKVVANNLP